MLGDRKKAWLLLPVKTAKISRFPRLFSCPPVEGNYRENDMNRPIILFIDGVYIYHIWYNGQNGSSEQIGSVIHNGKNLDF